MRSRALASLVILGACSGAYEPVNGDGGGADAADTLAREQFETTARPVIREQCAGPCHLMGLSAAPIYGDTYDSLNNYMMGKLFKCDPPEQSLIVTKGAHPPGVDFSSTTSRTTVLNWLEVWASVHPRCAGLNTRASTSGFVPNLDQPNTVSLADLGPGLEGAELTFGAQRVTGGLYLTSVRVNAGAGGLHVRAPRFEACLGGVSTPDPGNAFAAVDLMVEPNMSAALPPGSLSIAGWDLGDPLAVSFATLTPMAGSQGPAVVNGGSCSSGAPGGDGGVADGGP